MYSNVKAELARMNLTVVDLSKKTGIRYQSLANKINGKTPLKLEEARAIKTALAVDLPLEKLFEVEA